tara:strand:+ start:545 stop:850 length:306 start_codon:yes stop_codon:yes gene_type:complete
MATEVSENTQLTLDVKTIGLIIGFTVSLATTYFTLKSDIAIAMNEPKPEVSSIEFQYKDELVRSTIEKVESDVGTLMIDINEIKEQLNKMDERLYELSKKR